MDAWDPGLVPTPCPHSPVEFIVVIVDFPPEVEPGECEAEGDGEEQEPEAFPLEEQSRRGVKRGHRLAQQAACLNVPSFSPSAAKPARQGLVPSSQWQGPEAQRGKCPVKHRRA